MNIQCTSFFNILSGIAYFGCLRSHLKETNSYWNRELRRCTLLQHVPRAELRADEKLAVFGVCEIDTLLEGERNGPRNDTGLMESKCSVLL
jgi:hypothetical protein